MRGEVCWVVDDLTLLKMDRRSAFGSASHAAFDQVEDFIVDEVGPQAIIRTVRIFARGDVYPPIGGFVERPDARLNTIEDWSWIGCVRVSEHVEMKQLRVRHAGSFRWGFYLQPIKKATVITTVCKEQLPASYSGLAGRS
jgi:hypothetical protein